MSVALMEIYDHFRNTDTASIDDDHFSPVVTFANRVLGEHVLLQKLRVTKSELEAYDDDDLQDKTNKKFRSDQPHSLDEEEEEKTGTPLLLRWGARSSNQQTVLSGDGSFELELTEVVVEGSITLENQELHARVEFSENIFGIVVTLVITGTSAENFFQQWAGEFYQPQLEHIAVSEAVLVACSHSKLLNHERIVFPLEKGLSIILRAKTGDNIWKIIDGVDKLYLYGRLLDDQFNDVPLNLKSYPFFRILLGQNVRLTGSFFQISVKTPDNLSDAPMEDDEASSEFQEEPVPFAQLNLAGTLWEGANSMSFWSDVPADHEVLAFRMAGSGVQYPWQLDQLKPLLGSNAAVMDAFAQGIDGTGWKYRVIDMQYFYDLSMQTLYSLSLQLTLLNRGAAILPAGIRVELQQLALHCNVGTPDTTPAVSLWAEGTGSIGGVSLPLDIVWGSAISMSTGNDGPPPESLFTALGIEVPLLDQEMSGIASYRLDFLPPDGEPQLSLLPSYKAPEMEVELEQDDQESDAAIVLDRHGVVSWPTPPFPADGP